MPWLLGEIAALASIAAYVLAVGAQASVIRAGVVGALGSLAWIAARQRDCLHLSLLGTGVRSRRWPRRAPFMPQTVETAL